MSIFKKNKKKKKVASKKVASAAKNTTAKQSAPKPKQSAPKPKQNAPKSKQSAPKAKTAAKPKTTAQKAKTAAKPKKTAPKAKTAAKPTAPKPKIATKSKKPPKRKNVSQKIPNGRVLRTRDEFLDGAKDYRKAGYEKKGNYRSSVVIDSNRKNQVGLIPLYGPDSKAKNKLTGYKQGKSKYRGIVITKDEFSQPIKPGPKFIPEKAKNDVPKQLVTKMKKQALSKNNPYSKSNRKKLQELKGRKK